MGFATGPPGPTLTRMTQSMMQGMDLPELGLLLLVACCVAIGSARVRLPYAVGLVAAGLALGLAGFPGRAALTGHLLFGAILPPLIFEAALHLGWGRFRREAPLVLSLAFIGTALSAAVVAGLMHGLAGWGWPAALLFGALISATDPISVVALFRHLGIQPRLTLIVEGESLFNDATSLVLFQIAVSFAVACAKDDGDLDLRARCRSRPTTFRYFPISLVTAW